ncbi:MAG: serine dehydratase subunit alpha family protein [Firmicutes bacterium]|nr:serine dehydratase subunit alpha family protein [Bacillota bacterium]
MINNGVLLNILKNQVVPAIGCTEPTAVAYATAKAKELLDEDVKTLDIKVDKGVYKNGKEVYIPNTDKKGIVMASSLALVNGKAEYELEVLKDITDKDVKKALSLVENKIINLSIKKDVENLFIEAVAKGENHTAKVLIRNTHTNVVLLERDNECVYIKDEKESNEKSLRDKIRDFSIKELVEFSDTVDIADIDFLNEGIKMNKHIGKKGLDNKLGLGFSSLFATNNKDIKSYAKAITSAASEARMSGYPLPVMSSGGSGNQGLVTTLPVAIIGEGLDVSKEKITRGVALSHLLNIYIKTYTGSLAPICGCGISAGVGASAGIAYILDGDIKKINGAINNMISGVTGMICDGAKLGCALKLSIAVASAIDSAYMASNNIFISPSEGILDGVIEKSIKNLAIVSTEGMNNTDNVILEVMMHKSC